MKTHIFMLVCCLGLLCPRAAQAQVSSPPQLRLFVGNETGESLEVLDLDKATGQVIRQQRVPMGGKPYGLYLHGNRLYVACVARPGGTSEIEVYDQQTLSQVDSFAMDGVPFSLAVTKDGKRIFVTNRADNQVWSWDLTTRQLIKIPLRYGPWAEWAIKFCQLSADEHDLFVTGQGNGALYKIDLVSLQQTAAVQLVGGRGMVVLGNKLYVANEFPAGVTVVDVPSFQIAIQVGLDRSRGGVLTLTSGLDGNIVYVAQAFGPVIALDAASLAQKTSAEWDSSLYHYGVLQVGGFIGITSQAERGIYPNSVKLYDQNLKLANVIRVGNGPYLMTAVELTP